MVSLRAPFLWTIRLRLVERAVALHRVLLPSGRRLASRRAAVRSFARTMSRSRRSSGSTSSHGRSSRTRGRWIRICLIASHAPCLDRCWRSSSRSIPALVERSLSSVIAVAGTFLMAFRDASVTRPGPRPKRRRGARARGSSSADLRCRSRAASRSLGSRTSAQPGTCGSVAERHRASSRRCPRGHATGPIGERAPSPRSWPRPAMPGALGDRAEHVQQERRHRHRPRPPPAAPRRRAPRRSARCRSPPPVGPPIQHPDLGS